jgi:AcrR family transcriptional regulator
MSAAVRKTHRTYRGENMETRRARRRAQFLAAGKAVFGDYGFQGTTLRRICGEAGLTERYFYESFDNPQALFTAVHDAQLEHLREILTAAIAAAPREPEATARSVVEAYYELLRSDPRLTRILLIEIYGTTQDMERLYRRGIQEFADMIRDLVAARIDLEADPRLDPGLLASGLVGAAAHLALRWHMGGYAEPLDTVVANCMAIFGGMKRG